MTVLEVPATFVLPVDFRVSSIEGLVALHCFRSAPGSYLLSYWTSQEQAVLGLEQLRARTGLLPGAVATGAVTAVRVGDARWVTRALGWLTAAAGVVGAVALLSGAFLKLFEVPTAGLTHDDPSVLNVVESAQVSLPLRLLNRGSEATLSLRGAQVWLSASNSRRADLDVVVDSVPALEPAKDHTLVARGRAPKYDGSGPPAVWTLGGELSVKAGLAMCESAKVVPKRQVHVWKRSSWTSPRPTGNCGHDCWYRGRIYIGTNIQKGLRGEITVWSAKAVLRKFRVLTSPEAAVGPPHGDSNASKAIWTVGNLSAFSSYEYQLHVTTRDGKPITDAEWKDVKIEIDVEEVL